MAKSYRSELAEIQDYIDNFDPKDFSSAADLDFDVCDSSRLAVAKRIKDRIKRKKEMAESFAISMRGVEAVQPMISQKQIDDLLASYSK
jgi:hypothetical protein